MADLSLLENERLKMYHPIISIIVPAYKVEDYLAQCIKSLLAQTMKEIEIILIDDGSPDKCADICDRYALSDNRIRVIHQNNQGLSGARNSGLEAARGNFIMFVDGDDYVEADFCRIPYELAMKNDADIVIFSYKFQYYSGGKIETWHGGEEGFLSKETALRMLGTGSGLPVWNKLYRRELFETIRFPLGRYYEDAVVTPTLIHTAYKIYYTDISLYNYRFREESITKSKNNKASLDLCEMAFERVRLLETWGYMEEADRLKPDIYWHYLVTIGRKGKESGACLNYILEMDQIPESYSQNSRKLLKLLRFVPPLFDLACELTGRRINKK